MQFGSVEISTPEVMETLGVEIGRRCEPGLQIRLIGDLGAGKTTLVRGIAAGLGVTAPIASPTFAIVEDHGALVHVDWYRIDEEIELDAIDFDAYLEGSGVVVVEWADKYPHRLDDDSLTLEITAANGPRRVTASGSQDSARQFADVFTA